MSGTSHLFNVTGYDDPCQGIYSGDAGSATDGSGYYMDISQDPSGIVRSPAGITITGGTVTDTNGNYVSSTSPSSTETDWIDTLGRTALKIITGTSTIQYQFLGPTGTYQTITLNLQTLNIKTNFGCTGITEYTGTASLPSFISLPNGQSYQFTYEPTPGSAGYYTGRVQRVTLPTGGYYEYDYTGANDGINCADGTVLSMNRVVNDGTTSTTWSYSRAQNGTSGWTTTVTAPQLPYDTSTNQYIFAFNNAGQEISLKLYQGSATLLRTINTTWATNRSPASQVVILEDNHQSETDTTFDSNGNLLALKEYDWGAGAPGPVLRTTNFTYLSTSAYASLNIINRVSNETIADGGGTTHSRADIAYDAPSQINSPCISGVPQHNDTSYGCTFTARGDPTSVTTYTNAAAATGSATKNFTYDVFENLRTATVNCCQQEQWSYSATTQYAFPDSAVRGASGGPQLTTSFTYNSSTSLPATVTDPNNQTTSFSYDTLKRLTTITRPDQAQITYAYNDAQHTVTLTRPVQATTVIQRMVSADGLGRPIQFQVLDGSGVSYSIVNKKYDPLGRTYQVSNPHNSTPQYWSTIQFDAAGRATKLVLPDNTQKARTYSGPSVTVTDPAGEQRKFQFDGVGRLASAFEPDPTNGNSLTLQTSYAYTVLNRRASITQGVQTRTFNHDDMGRLTSVTTPEGGTVNYQYNNFGKVTQRTDARGVVTTYSYDTLNRLTQASYNVGSTGVSSSASVSYTYGTNATQYNNGRLVTITDGVGSKTYAYDNLGHVTQASKVISGTTYTVGYQYNLAGKATAWTYPSGRVVQQSYDAIGRVSSISSGTTTYASGFTYNTAMRGTGFQCGNGVIAALNYSPDRLQLQSISHTKPGQTLFSLSYGYAQNGGNNGQITSITDNVDSGRSATYTYDALGRLSSAVTTGSTTYPQWGLSWSYDRYSNRAAQTVTAGTAPSNSVTIDPTTNRISGPGYGYDASGNMTSDGLNQLVYDAANRLVSSTSTLGAASYSHDAAGRRVVKTSGGTTTVYIYSGKRVIAEYTNGVLSAEYFYMGNRLFATYLNGTLYYHHFDKLSVRASTDASGNKVGEQATYPFGEGWYINNTGSKYRFTNYEMDPESNNHYAIHRYQVNRLGRFSGPDPIGHGGGSPQKLNRYSYVANDPINRRDSRGLDVTDDVMDEDHGGDGSGGVDMGSGDGLGMDNVGADGDPGNASAEADSSGQASADESQGQDPNAPPDLPPPQFDPNALDGLLGPNAGLGSPPPPCADIASTYPDAVNFVADNLDYAQTIADYAGTTSANILGLSSLESGNGSSNLAQNYNNYFGLTKGTAFRGTVGTYTTPPDALGNRRQFGIYDSPGFSMSGMSFALSFQGERVSGTTSPADFAAALTTAPLAFNSEPGYSGLLVNRVNLAQAIIDCLNMP